MPAILYNLLSGLRGQMRSLDVASQNITNSHTPGYRKERVQFHDVMYQAMLMSHDRSGRPQPAPIGNGAELWPAELVQSQGSLEQTGSPFDLAIQGDGFFQFRQPDGALVYSRNGQLQLDDQRRLVNADGLLLDPPIQLPADIADWTVAADGTVSVLQPDGNQRQVGQLQIVRFPNASALQQTGAFTLQATARSGQPIQGAPGSNGLGGIVQSFVEASNVDFSEEMTNLLQAQRTYEIGLKALQTIDDAIGMANNIHHQ
jgi:flagellar basal-body rod protein FlgG